MDIEARHGDDIETIAAAVETKHITLIQSPEPVQDGNTEGVTKGDETVDDDVPHESHGCHDTLQKSSRSRARARTQRIILGKPSTPVNSDTALTTIRPTPVPPEEYHDAAGGEDHRQGEATEKAKPTHTQPGRNLVEVEDNADWTPPAPQPAEVPNETTSGASDRTLDIEAEYEEDIKAGRRGPRHIGQQGP